MVIKAANLLANQQGITTGQVVADAQAILPALEVRDDEPDMTLALLKSLTEWCLRFTPNAAIHEPDGIMLDISGCPHLWGGEPSYLNTIAHRFLSAGYQVRLAIADSIGTAWAMARYGEDHFIVETGTQALALAPLPPEALRLENAVLQCMQKLGFRQIGQFMNMPAPTLRRRFGDMLLQRLGQALGSFPETIKPVQPIEPFQERLPCMEPILTLKGIEIALERLLCQLCKRLERENKGIRSAIFKGYRMDGNVQEIGIGTSRASNNIKHLMRLFDIKLSSIEPASGIELFVIEATLVEDICDTQEAMWDTKGGQNKVAELLDNIAGKIGMEAIHRYLPAEHHWPERSVVATHSLDKMPETKWPIDKLRPLHLLTKPEPIDVMVPLPDYPPVLFTHKGKVFKLMKADGPERIEQEWWMADGQPRDYYRVEDEKGARYWLFRSGHYANGPVKWFLHGFFA